MYEMNEELKCTILKYLMTFFPILCLMCSTKKKSGKQ